ncbi:MAG: formyltransferase [Burkholderiaceae bacterium]|uniref:Formyltransferase n=1 Tax=Cupriavidus metallidurans TaxID=119219 RepID=A0A2L0X338_9BURK|nr:MULTISPECIES: formyltransferase [Cupriavidus]PCH56832.1 MAG: formyltransferase [Burkholderiaceae bacterium]AVA34528.1 formyltransferase [Cupriavidus metallidurans]KWR86334.1 formyltransferase [Cupriavidus sp. SHE]QBP12422.1 formyltransferase [Cupriavidus metallidurans]QWC92370.1 formyltransferase [Cupriavidus metallidurans]
MRAVVFAYHNVGDRCLRVLHARGVDVALVVTHRDRPDENIWFRRVADTAAELNLSFIYGEDPTDPALAEAVRAAKPDVIFSFYYRSMIPADLLAVAPQGAFNMHGSLLPKYRGRVPVNWAVLRGEEETGATLHAMEAKPDAGYIVDQTSVPILPDDTAGEVFEKVTVAAEQTLWRALPAMMAGQTPKRPNVLSEGSYFSGRKPEDGRIDFSQPAAAVYNLIRAVAPPYPGAFTDIGGRRFIVARARRIEPSSVPAGLKPGLHVVDGRIVAVGGDGGAIRVTQLLEGPNADNASPVSVQVFQNIITAKS